MNEVERLSNALFSPKGVGKLENIKFFMGENRNITQTQLLAEAQKGAHQVSLGLVEEKLSIDSHAKTINISQFAS